MKNFFYIFIIFFFFSVSVNAQNLKYIGSSLMNNFSSDEYRANPQNWSIIEDDRGVVYFGNTSGLLSFNGTDWSLNKTYNESIIRTLSKSESGKIYYGANGDFGFLIADSTGNIQLNSLISFLPDENKQFNDVHKIFPVNNNVYFVASDKIFILKNEKIEVLEFESSSRFGALIYKTPFFISKKGGIYTYQNKQMMLLPQTKKITQDAGRCQLLPFKNDKILIATEKKGLFVYNIGLFYDKNTQKYNFNQLIDATVFYKINTSVNDYLSVNKIYSGIKINDNEYAIGTVYGGIIFFNAKGKLLQIINKNRGLNNHSVIDLYKDSFNNIWVATLQGLAYISKNNPLTFFCEKNGILGSVYTVKEYNNTIFAGTANGCFYLPSYEMTLQNDFNNFSKLQNLNFAVWEYVNLDDILFASSRKGVLKIEDLKIQQFTGDKSTYTIAHFNEFKNKLFVGLIDGFSVISLKKNNNNKFEIEQSFLFDEIKSPIRDIKISPYDNSLWLTSSYDGVYNIKFDDFSSKDYQIIKYDTTNGLPNMSYNYVYFRNKKIYFLAATGQYLLKKDTIVKEIIFKPDKNDTLNIIEIIKKDNKNWFLTANSEVGYFIENNDSIEFYYQPFLKLLGKSIYNIYLDKKGFLWLCSNEGVFNFNTNKKVSFDQDYNAIITKVLIGKDSLIFNGNFTKKQNYYFTKEQPENKTPVLDYKNNSIRFEFSSTFYEDYEKNQFSYKLEGFDKEWSDWNTEKIKEYNYLKKGNYTFKIKAKNIYSNVSKVTSYSFIVKPPWYKTTLAYIIYVFLVAILVYLIVYLNSLRLKKRNQRLEEIILQRTTEIREKNQVLSKQKEEIQTQAEKLRITNKELEKLSIVASETDNSVLIMDEKGYFRWVNDGFKRLYGYSLDEFKNRFGDNIIEVTSNKEIKDIINKCIVTKTSAVYESQFKTKNRDNLWLQTTLTPITDENNNVSKIIAVETDIRKLKKYEQEILQKNEEINTQKEELEVKNDLLKQHNESIKASIRYAQTIQQAILPSVNKIKQFFESFVFYKPKDIVSGDFYWFSHFRKTDNYNEKSFAAAIDCTGHGVPGAFMSMIANTLLNEIINEKKIFSPKVILKTISNTILNSLKQEETDNQDGMDMCLVKIENLDKQKTLVSFAGAKRPLFYYSDKEKTVNRLRGDRISIGGTFYRKEKYFTNHSLTLFKNDILYLTSDGYIDQNNTNRKRFGTQRFMELIDKIAKEEMKKQEEILDDKLKKWQGQEIQRDDIIIMALKIK